MKEIKKDICSLCGGVGWKYSKDSKYVVRCDCRKELARKNRIDSARIPLQYQGCTLDNYDTFENISLHTALKKAKGFSKKYPACSKGLLFMGASGVGKTHLAVGVLKAVLKKGAKVLFFDFQDLLREIQETYQPDSGVTEFSLLEPVLNGEIIVLDDVGSKKATEWVRDTLAYIITHRYNSQLLTVLTTNYLDEDVIEDGYTLSDRIGERLRSRLYEMCDRVYMEGDDFRREIRQHR